MRRFAQVGALFVLVLGCRQLDSESFIGGARSPEDSRIAVARKLVPIGGALATDSYSIAVLKSGTSGDGAEVWRSGGVLPAMIFWIDEKTLEVLVYSESSAHFATIRSARRDDLRIVTRVLRRGGKAMMCDSDSLEVVPSKPL